MRVAVLVLIGLLGIAGNDASVAQTRAEMERCRTIADESRRLGCYDDIDLLAFPSSKYQLVNLAELQSFALSFRGQLIETTGWIRPGPRLSFLGLDADDAHPLPVDIEALPRHRREEFFAVCGDGCAATVQGRVRPVNFTTGIVAEAVIVY